MDIKIEDARHLVTSSTLHETNHTKFSLRKVSTVVPACMIALEHIVALWQTLFLISTACFIVFKI
jgi:hypothetical protein